MHHTQLYHLVIYTPLSHAEAVRGAIASAGGGKIGDYDSCSFSAQGIGRFRPLKGAKPHIGSEGETAEVKEERIEVVIEEQNLQTVIAAAKNAHPYEEPAIHFWKMEDHHTFFGGAGEQPDGFSPASPLFPHRCPHERDPRDPLVRTDC